MTIRMSRGRYSVDVSLSLTHPEDEDNEDAQLHLANVRQIITEALEQYGYLTPERAGPVGVVSTDDELDS